MIILSSPHPLQKRKLITDHNSVITEKTTVHSKIPLNQDSPSNNSFKDEIKVRGKGMKTETKTQVNVLLKEKISDTMQEVK